MNINYLKLDKLPRYGDGWEATLKTLRGGQFFVTTGEILIPQFSVNGKESGDTIKAGVEKAVMEAQLEWTFPLAFAEIISGDGKLTHRQRIDLSDAGAFGTRTLRIPVNLSGKGCASKFGISRLTGRSPSRFGSNEVARITPIAGATSPEL